MPWQRCLARRNRSYLLVARGTALKPCLFFLLVKHKCHPDRSGGICFSTTAASVRALFCKALHRPRRRFSMVSFSGSATAGGQYPVIRLAHNEVSFRAKPRSGAVEEPRISLVPSTNGPLPTKSVILSEGSAFFLPQARCAGVPHLDPEMWAERSLLQHGGELSLLPSVEEPCRQKDHRHKERKLRVLHGAVVEADKAIHEPCSEAEKPDPCEVPHRAMMRPDWPRRPCKRTFMWVLYTE